MTRRYEFLQEQGLVVTGNFSGVNTVTISEGGEYRQLAVQSEYVPSDEVTLFHPLGTFRQPTDVFDDPVYRKTVAEIEGAREPARMFMPGGESRTLKAGVEVNV